MSRDGRGTPGRIVLKNQPRLRLADVLRRRRTTLKKLLDEIGLSTYGGLINWCDRMGIAPPTKEEFDHAIPPSLKVNSPQEGVVVLEPPAVIADLTGQPIDPELPWPPADEAVVETVDEPTEPTQKKRRIKKDG